MRRRAPFSLPNAHHVPLLRRLLDPAADLGKQPDAGRLLAAAERHNVLIHVLAAVEAGRLTLPPDLLTRARERAARRALHARLLRRALPGVAAIMSEACAAEPVVIKGPAVADRFYSDPALRPFVDLDLLVPRDGLAAAAAALRREGYEVEGEFRPGYSERYGHDLHAWLQGPPRVDVDVHWRVGDDPAADALDHAFAADGAERLEVEGGSVLVPRAGRQLLVLAVHLLRDPSKRLASVNDVALAAGSLDDPEWEGAFSDAQSIGLAWVLHRALDYARFHLGFERTRPRPAGDPPPFGPLRAIEEIDVPAARHIGWLAALSWRERPGYLRAVLVPSREGLGAREGAGGAPIARQLMRHGARAVRGLRQTRR